MEKELEKEVLLIAVPVRLWNYSLDEIRGGGHFLQHTANKSITVTKEFEVIKNISVAIRKAERLGHDYWKPVKFYLVEKEIFNGVYNEGIRKGDLFYKTDEDDIVTAEYSPASLVSRKVIATPEEIAWIQSSDEKLEPITTKHFNLILENGGNCHISMTKGLVKVADAPDGIYVGFGTFPKKVENKVIIKLNK